MTGMGGMGNSGGPSPFLSLLSVDLTEKARRGEVPLASNGSGPDGEIDDEPEHRIARWWRTSLVARVLKIAIPAVLVVGAVWFLLTTF